MEKMNMTKIAVVGVDGSGKTVLMAAMGEMYESPDADGYFLSAEDSRTFHNVKALVGRMRGGAWPGATDAQSVTDLNWMLCRQGEESVQRLAEISFSDYAGEIYRLAFGEHPEDEVAPFKGQVDTLKAHIREADTLLVLVNLKDIISGDLTNLRTREMLWLTKDIVDYAFAERRRSNGKREVALVFTQSSTYSEVIGAADGLAGAYRKYLPHVASLYPSLKLFAVSAVDRTVLDADGYEIPAQDFKPQGLENLVSWVVDYVVEAERRAAQAEKRKRWKNGGVLLGVLGILGLWAWIGYNVDAGFHEWVDGRLATIGWMQKETSVHAEPRPAVPAVNPVEEQSKPPVEPAKPPKPEPKWVAGIQHPKYPHVVSSANEGKLVPERGYVWANDKQGDFSVKWIPGRIVNGRKTGNREGEWLKKCTQCDGTGSVTKRTKCRSCDGSGKIRTTKDCADCDGSGKVRTASRAKCPNCGRDEVKNLIGRLLLSTSVDGKVACPRMGAPNYAMNNLGTFNGQFLGMKHVFLKGSCSTCGGQGRFISPMGMQNCISCGGYGYFWEFCNACNGTGVKDCDTCGGSGEVRRTEESTCNNCNGDGWVYKSSQCSYCEGKGESSSTSSCGTCNGEGWVVE